MGSVDAKTPTMTLPGRSVMWQAEELDQRRPGALVMLSPLRRADVERFAVCLQDTTPGLNACK